MRNESKSIPSPQAKALFENALDRALKTINADCNLPTLEAHTEVFNTLRELVLSDSDIEDYLDFRAHGCYKECYEMPYNSKYIVKFAIEDNDTTSEQYLLEAAKGRGLGALFIPTFFVPLFGYTLYAARIAADEDFDDGKYTYDEENNTYVEREDWVGPECDTLIIQPIIDKLAGPPKHNLWMASAYPLDENLQVIYKDPLIHPDTGEIIEPDDIRFVDIHDREWLEAFLHCYGLEKLKALNAFCRDFHISDLHGNNIGYLNGKPIIIDWLSMHIDKSTDLH